ncbi:carbohydrate ABC transporter ATP-binding protein (CUT1 family) [Pacificibacter maritimus]|uniref:Carbohydrate ABC transporter ATP-binding protein (CUT1 family) n=1 Tax=Pacificibacter maritimus TaxID=762213 RepID=A0A3N4UMI0_9RHOB|nr:ATP-binding cassette domain-containing protein [Pacificibacter maritimus]RPE71663.1 carbohydrate ABC transporter ATP-binding protein (CUT1 family) [Pacificibacter maritimus]
MARLQLKNVEKTYGNGFKAVHGINLDIEDGEFMVFVGPSGCAKSTTLRMIAGLETISGGEVHIGDTIVNDLAPGKRGLAMVFQNYALYPHMKVKNNLGFGLRLKRKPKDQIAKATKDVSGILEIEELLERLPKELSGGQAQRVAVGRALIKSPEVFLFDEPLSNLDAKLRASMRVRITDLHKELREAGRPATVVYVTHDQVEAMTMGDRICVMKSGHIMQVADPVTLFERPANDFVAGFIGMPEMNIVDGVLDRESGANLIIGSQTISGGAALAARLTQPSGPVKIGIRPQHLTYVPKGTENAFEGKVTVIEFMGHEVNLHINIEGHSFICVIPSEIYDRSLKRGDTVYVAPLIERLHVFDPETGVNVSLGQESA